MEWYQLEKVPKQNGKEYLEKTIKKGSASVLFDTAYAMLPFFLLQYFIKQQQVNDDEDHKMQVQNDSEKLFFKLILQKNFQHFGSVKFSLLTGTNYLHGNKPCIPLQSLSLIT